MKVLQIENVSIPKPGSERRRALGQIKGSTSAQELLVDQVSCSLNAGQILAIIGPNGAGKSTLIKAIAGDLPYQGKISFSNFSQNAKLRARQIAVLPQFSLLSFAYRVSEVVALARIPHQTGSKMDAQIVDQALDMMDIGFLKNRPYTELSGGEKQRVQLARAMAQIWRSEDANGSRLLVLDEPTTALDLGHQQSLMQAVKLFATQGVAVLMVLHDINLAARYADKLLALLCSQQIAFGDVSHVVSKQNIERLFSIEAQIIDHPVHGTPIVLGI